MFTLRKNIYLMFSIILSLFCSNKFDLIDYNNNQIDELSAEGIILDDVELKYFNQNLSMLKPEELGVLNNVIENQLIKKKDNHYLLLLDLNQAMKVLDEILILNKALNNMSNNYDTFVNLNDDIINEIRINRKKIYNKIYNLECYSGKYFIILRKHFRNSSLPNNKIKFYVFILNFIQKIIEYIHVIPFQCNVKTHYSYLLKFYQIYEKYIKTIINNIPLPIIILHTEKCILEEDIEKYLKKNILSRMGPLKRNIIRFYEDIEQIFHFVQNIEKMINESINK
ncbi:uncharacterized protein VNE69_02089 [Vairimorpha necatrix]|uniref:Uncharacterized protein n=1 Tax=Vairimorpha necatrix TaxID=6039 RepID=A0AAX4J9A9_9MICR